MQTVARVKRRARGSLYWLTRSRSCAIYKMTFVLFAPLTGLGCMRLSTAPDRDEDRAVAVLHAALDAGIRFLDTSDAYCFDAAERGHNERLIARALASWHGDRSSIVIATKGGLTRPQGQWIADGRARYLAEACEASRRALGVDRIALYQLHAVDPRTPLATSVRALDALKQQGLIDGVGLCNVTRGQIEEARGITAIATVQVEINPWHDENLLNGVAEYCATHDITLIAHRPLGGPARARRLATDPVLASVAARHQAAPADVVLAWLRDLSPIVLPVPGATRVESVRSIAGARNLVLSDDDRNELDRRFPAGVRLRRPFQPPPGPTHGDVVIVMGLPGAGKSTLAAALVADGYARLNRDEAGGGLDSLRPALDALIAAGSTRVVLDNTYMTRRARATVIDAARRRGLAVRCVWLQTSIEDAQINAVQRILARHGRLLDPDGLRAARKRDPAAFGPSAQFRHQRELEPPDLSEGFARIDLVPFERRRDPACNRRAVIVWCDGILRRSRAGLRTPSSVDEEEIAVERGEVLRRYQDEGWLVLGLSWQPEIDEGRLATSDVDAAFARLRDALGVAIEIEYCPHRAGPPVCWCRKPLPGLAVVFVERHHLDPARCIYVGASPQDPLFARRLGFTYQDADTFFAARSPEP